MAFINEKNQEINFKVVYVGPALSGKTSSLEALHKRTRGKSKSKMLKQESNPRTLFFDFMPLSLGKVGGYKTRFHLYSVPGQVLYEDSRNLILKGVDGVVFVANSEVDQMEANLASLKALESNLSDQGLQFKRFPHVIQYNKRDLKGVGEIKALKKLLNQYKAPDFETNAKKGEGIFEAFSALAKAVIRDYAKVS
ncbi:MAG: GTPase domain-containing protein [Deltaproteobacteria bacterium]|nr:GTPase domain-containing protein [Deltaproteobacteria bacterium]